MAAFCHDLNMFALLYLIVLSHGHPVMFKAGWVDGNADNKIYGSTRAVSSLYSASIYSWTCWPGFTGLILSQD